MSAPAASATFTRPPGLLYALDESLPRGRLVLPGVQYAVIDAIYLILVAVIVRHAQVPYAERVTLLGLPRIAVAIGTVLQALARDPGGFGFLARPVFSTTCLTSSVLAAEIGCMPFVFGMTLFAGVVEVMIALALMRLRIVITPILSGSPCSWSDCNSASLASARRWTSRTSRCRYIRRRSWRPR